LKSLLANMPQSESIVKANFVAPLKGIGSTTRFVLPLTANAALLFAR